MFQQRGAPLKRGALGSCPFCPCVNPALVWGDHSIELPDTANSPISNRPQANAEEGSFFRTYVPVWKQDLFKRAIEYTANLGGNLSAKRPLALAPLASTSTLVLGTPLPFQPLAQLC